MRIRYTLRTLALASIAVLLGFALLRFLHDSLERETWQVASIHEAKWGGTWAHFDTKTRRSVGGPLVHYYAVCINRGHEIAIPIGTSETLHAKPFPLSPGDQFWLAADRGNAMTRDNPRFIDLGRVGILVKRRADGSPAMSAQVAGGAPTPAYQ